MRLVGGLGVPHEGLVGKIDGDALFKQRLPYGLHLLALAYGVGGYEGRAHGLVRAHVGGRLFVPAGHVVDRLYPPEQRLAVARLLGRVVGISHKWWVAHDVGALRCRQHRIPIGRQCVAAMDVVVGGERQKLQLADGVATTVHYLFGLGHHLFFGDPQGGFGHRDGEVVYLDAEKLPDGHLDGAGLSGQREHALAAVQVLQHAVFQCAQRKVAFREEVARAAGRVEDA